MSEPNKRVALLDLRADGPTELRRKDLYSWVVWQYPRKIGQGLCGAVSPPLAKHGWYPAEIKNKGQLILVHGQIRKPFKTPSAAADWLSNKKE